jgi:EAL domain-containing protein (putative c-di-GMP-specific phosphodiesterase class I)
MPDDLLPRDAGPPGCSACRDGVRLPFKLRMAFQPMLDLRSGRVFAQEALVRGPDGQGAGWVMGQIDDQLRYAFDQACRVTAIREATRLGLDGAATRLSINFMPNAIYEPENCIRSTLRAAEKTGLPLSSLMFEFTEAEQVRDVPRLRAIVDAYKRMGFTVALDDFGAGFAGLGLLSDLVPDVVKLDMSLIRGIDGDAVRRAIVSGCLSMCRELGVTVVAEGVETAAELDTVARLGIPIVQGHLLARPAMDLLPEPATVCRAA